MLQRQTYHDPQLDAEAGLSLTPDYLLGVLRRRALYFALPCALVFVIGSAIAWLWPARYISQGTILVQSQEIPSDLVRPTIAALANDRIQIIEQRVMTRDNLLGIAKKYGLTSGWLERLSGTEIVDFLRKRTLIKPSEQKLESRKKEAIAFTIGFEYENPAIATKVANELVTMMLSEDVRSRTEFAAQTTRFLAQEVTRLETRLASLDAQIIALRKTRLGTLGSKFQLDGEKSLETLKAELMVKSATYSANHPDIQALKRKIAALEKGGVSDTTTAGIGTDGTAGSTRAAGSAGLDTLETQRDTVKEELNKATQKLSAARMGENLEKGQHSERLEVIEQPTMPYKPVSPNRPKIFIMVMALSLMAGGGMVFAAEMLNQSIRTRADLYSLIDRQMIVSIPYIATHDEVTSRRTKRLRWIVLGALAVIAGLTVLYFVLPPLDILLDNVMRLVTRRF
ncbi:MAG TPA: sugar transporter [Pseudolabrys sp.]|nr:sugar transporter [Pseudolabrys sp.]